MYDGVAKPDRQIKLFVGFKPIGGTPKPKKGYIVMQVLSEDLYADLDCLYYMVLCYYHLEDVVSSRKCLNKLLNIAQNFQQDISLMDILEDKITKDGFIGI